MPLVHAEDSLQQKIGRTLARQIGVENLSDMKPDEIRAMSRSILSNGKMPDPTNNAPAPENREEVVADEVDAGDYDSSLTPITDGYQITLRKKKVD